MGNKTLASQESTSGTNWADEYADIDPADDAILTRLSTEKYR